MSALDGLAADDLHGLPSAELLDRVAELVRARNRIDAELARTVRRAELTQAAEHDGLKTMSSWLRGHCRLSPAAAGQLVRNGRALEQLPAVAAAHAAGAVSAEQVAVIGRLTRPRYVQLLAAQGGRLAGDESIDAVLAGFAATRTHEELSRLVHVLTERLDQDGPEPDPTTTRSLTLATHPDGRVTGRFDLDPVGGEKVRAAIESILRANRPAGDERSQFQRQADALVQLCATALATGALPMLRRVKPHVGVVVGLQDLLDSATGPASAEMGFGATISAAA